MPLALVVDDFRRSSSEAQAAAVHREIARQTSCSQSSLVHHRECHNRFSCSQIPVSHFTQSQTIDRTCMSNMCGAALHLDMTTLARVGHKPQPQGRECAGSLARHERKRASVNGHDVAAGSLSWAVTGASRGSLEALPLALAFTTACTLQRVRGSPPFFEIPKFWTPRSTLNAGRLV